jgi:hypothetical protein
VLRGLEASYHPGRLEFSGRAADRDRRCTRFAALSFTPHKQRKQLNKTLPVLVWDLETYACLLTHRGVAPYRALAATATTIVARNSARSTTWCARLQP